VKVLCYGQTQVLLFALTWQTQYQRTTQKKEHETSGLHLCPLQL
jgi:hypothetical protein